MVGVDLQGGLHPLVVVRRREPDVDDGHVGEKLRTLRSRSPAVRQHPTTSSPFSSSRRARPSRSRTLFSAITARTGSPLATGCRLGVGSRSAAVPRALHAVREPFEPRAELGVGVLLGAVVDDLDDEQAVRPADLDAGRRRVCVLADVGQALRDEVEGGNFQRLGKLLVELDRELDRNRCAGGELLERYLPGRAR